MPLKVVRSGSNRSLWSGCVKRFLDQADPASPSATGHSHIWLTHRLHRDALFEAAAQRGIAGWLNPPISFFSDLPRLFSVRQPPIGLLGRIALVRRLAREHGIAAGIVGAANADRRGIGIALDGLLGELVPEGVTPDSLGETLKGLAVDEFSARRNVWVVSVYAAYLEELGERGQYDPRAIHSIVADRIAGGALTEALGGAERLHIYGLASIRTRRRLIEALRDQNEVEVVLYLSQEDEPGEWDDFGAKVELLPGDTSEPEVQPVPDGRREFEWIACKVKELLASGAAGFHDIALVARTGRGDTRGAHEILNSAGIPNTARIRSPLAEIPALKALLGLFRGAARGWKYRPLRHVLESSYFNLNVDLRSIDYIARKRRVEGLGRWAAELNRLRDVVATTEDDWRYRKEGLFSNRLERDCESFEGFRKQVEELSAPRPLAGWVELTRSLLNPGWFDFRSRLCSDDGGRYEIVRLDQRGVERLDRMLQDWPELEEGGEAIEPAEWYARLRRLLESNELALTTPLQTGVQIVEAHEAALFPFKHTFVVHANDGEFPKRPPTPVIFSEEERRALAERGLPVTHRELWLRRERALWRAVTNNPNVTITYRTADPNGVPLLPSLMVPDHDASLEIPRTQFTWPAAFNAAHARRTAAARLAELKKNGEPRPIAVMEPAALKHAVLGAYAESQRRADPVGTREEGTLNPWNGELRDPWLLDYLKRRFDTQRLWSPSQLESYAECPFIYFIQRVLWLDELAEAEEETTPLTFGSVAHAILERFYPALLQGRFPEELDDDSRRLFERVAAEVLAEAEGDEDDWLGLPALWRVTKLELVQKVSDYLEWELPDFGPWRPHDFEHRFGYSDTDVVEIDGVDIHGAQQTIRVIGRIDRVDVRGDGPAAVYRVLDYKSGGIPAKTHYEHGVVQIPLYMKALARKLEARVDGGSYRSIKNCKENGQVTWGDSNFERALRIALSIPARARAGKFEPRAAKSVGYKWPFYWPGLEVCRVLSIYKEGSRFDEGN